MKRAGASRYLVEPNIKEGKGGLRDLNTLFWISKYVYRVQNPHDLIAAGVFSPREFALFRRCEEVPLVGALPAAFSRRPGGGAPELRRPAADRPAARLFDPGRPGRRRTLHEALFPRRQGRRRPDGDRLRRARGAPDEAHAGVRPVHRTPAAPQAARHRGRQGLQGRSGPRQRRPRRCVRARSGEPDPALLDRGTLEPADSPERDPARHPVAEAHRRPIARGPRGQPPVSGDPDVAPRAGNRASADERGRRARSVHPRFRSGRRDDAIFDVSPLHRRRASDPGGRRAERDRGGAAEGRTPAFERVHPQDLAPHRTLPRRVPARHRQGTADRSFEDRRRGRAQALPAARAVARRTPIASPRWSTSISIMSNMAQGRDLSDPRTAEALAAIVQTQEQLKCCC